MSSPYTPGVAGYAGGVLVSGGVILVSGSLLLGPYAVYVLVPLVVLGVPVGVVGAVVTHLVCRDVPDQRVHVFVAGLCGFTFALLLVVGDGAGAGTLVLSTWVALAAAIGRAWASRSVPERPACRGPR
jgi:hypothetical protein